MAKISSVRGPYRAGKDTRERLLAAALVLFSRQGFDTTSTRAIAAEADVAIPAIAYHFGGKDGLHLACADHVVERYTARMGDHLGTLSDRLPMLEAEEARSALRGVMTMLLGMLDETRQDNAWLAFMIREMNEQGPAHDRLYEGLWQPGLSLVAALIARCRGAGRATGGDRMEALLLLSSPSVFSYARRVALSFGGWAELDASLLRAIAEHLDARIAAL